MVEDLVRTVYFFTSPMCAACSDWKPTIDEFVGKNTMRCIVLRLNPNLKDYEFEKWRVKYTPSAAVLENGVLLRYVEGELLTAEELESFVFGLTWKSAARAKRVSPVVAVSPDDDGDEFEEDPDLFGDEDENE
jgi:hypothetical protein